MVWVAVETPAPPSAGVPRTVRPAGRRRAVAAPASRPATDTVADPPPAARRNTAAAADRPVGDHRAGRGSGGGGGAPPRRRGGRVCARAACSRRRAGRRSRRACCRGGGGLAASGAPLCTVLWAADARRWRGGGGGAGVAPPPRERGRRGQWPRVIGEGGWPPRGPRWPLPLEARRAWRRTLAAVSRRVHVRASADTPSSGELAVCLDGHAPRRRGGEVAQPQTEPQVALRGGSRRQAVRMMARRWPRRRAVGRHQKWACATCGRGVCSLTWCRGWRRPHVTARRRRHTRPALRRAH
ncbi:hypothetical protein BU14_0194s0009 [Porphyra umbilicalis]|uniref:Uncharacterized protein n=1 Tax=Porphyra umbilicalis TaxID=2786 RepID=A0A1X6P6L2_PORUM|nr:hypothetical protein BU14_0194s0009 [Porphyra umbilicalis]|eukprot:OSX76370.1 hypothetical protein BU14_0194s0009 [Porphyra umbilicalis]